MELCNWQWTSNWQWTYQWSSVTDSELVTDSEHTSYAAKCLGTRMISHLIMGPHEEEEESSSS